MLDIKYNNLFTFTKDSDSYGIGNVIEFYDLEGKNVIHIGERKFNSINNIKMENPMDIQDILKSNLFKVDIIVISSKINNVIQTLSKAREVTNLPIIFVVEVPISLITINIMTKFDTIFDFKKIEELSQSIYSLNKPKYLIKSIKDNWESNLNDLKIQYIRNKNLADLLGDVE